MDKSIYRICISNFNIREAIDYLIAIYDELKKEQPEEEFIEECIEDLKERL